MQYGPMMIVMSGLPGSGKSTLSRQIRDAVPRTVIVSSDALRRSLFGVPTYGDGESRALFETIRAMIPPLLEANMNVIVDATNLRYTDRFLFERIAVGLVAAPRLVYVTADMPDIEKRLEARERGEGDPEDTSDAGIDIYERMAGRAQLPSAAEPCLMVNTSHPNEVEEAMRIITTVWYDDQVMRGRLAHDIDE